MKHNSPLRPIIFIYLHFFPRNKLSLLGQWAEEEKNILAWSFKMTKREKIIRMRSRAHGRKNIVKLKEYYWFLYLWNNIAQPSISSRRLALAFCSCSGGEKKKKNECTIISHYTLYFLFLLRASLFLAFFFLAFRLPLCYLAISARVYSRSHRCVFSLYYFH